MAREEFLAPELKHVPSQEEIVKHSGELSIQDRIENASLEEIHEILENICQYLAEDPKRLDKDPSVRSRMNAVGKRIVELTGGAETMH